MTRVTSYRIGGIVLLLCAATYLVFHTTRGASPQRTDAAEQTTSAQSVAGGDNFPAFHNGGPLLGLAGPIGAPPMRLRWQFKSEDDPAPTTQPNASPTIITPGYEGSAVIVDG